MALSIILFAFLIYVSGLAVVQIATGRYRLDFEAHVASTGVGLATFSLITVIFGLFNVRLAWHWYAAATLGLFVLGSLRDILSKQVSQKAKERVEFWTPDTWYLVAAIGLAALLLACFVNGAFTTPWLIDDDSWHHAVAAKYVALDQTYHVDVSVRARIAGYLEPYPVAYPALMGVLHQVQLMGKPPMGSVVWTLKFFNCLLIALGLVYFYLMMKQWTRSPRTALWMTGVLWALPCFMSHFIWAQTLALVLFFPAFWAMERARGEPRWNLVAGVVVAGVLLAQPSSAFIFVLMAAIYWAANLFLPSRTPALEGPVGRFRTKEALLQLGALVLGGALSLLYYIPEIVKFGWRAFLETVTRTHLENFGPQMSGVGRGVYYGPWDFIWAPASTHINQPTGVGFALFFVFVAAVVWWCMRWKEIRASRLHVVALAWLALGTLGILGNYLPVNLFPHRFWAFFAIPVAIVTGDALAAATAKMTLRGLVLSLGSGALVGAAVALWGLGPALQNVPPVALTGGVLYAAVVCSLAAAGVAGYALTRDGIPAAERKVALALAAVAAGVALTSGYPKARFEGFSAWEPGTEWYQGRVVDSQEHYEHIDLGSYVGLREALAPNTPILGLTCPESRIIGFDFYEPPLDDRLYEMRETLAHLPLERIDANVAKEIYSIAVARKFPYATVDFYWAALPQRRQALSFGRRQEIRQKLGISVQREAELVTRSVTPTPREAPYLPVLEALVARQRDAEFAERDALARIDRLRNVLKDSGLFRKIGQSTEFGLTLYQVEPPKTSEEK